MQNSTHLEDKALENTWTGSRVWLGGLEGLPFFTQQAVLLLLSVATRGQQASVWRNPELPAEARGAQRGPLRTGSSWPMEDSAVCLRQRHCFLT